MAEQDRIMMIYSVIKRGKSKQYMEMLDERSIRFHLQTAAFGTAPSEMLDIFGLGSNDKDVIISYAPEKTVRSFMNDLGKNVGTSSEYGGLMMSLHLSAINRIPAEIITRASAVGAEKGEKTMNEKNKHQHQLIWITVNQGYTDQVMQTAKKAGAMGGTILRARLAGTERLEQFGEVDIQEEKEIITILAPSSTAAEIINAVNAEHGTKSEAHGMIVALPVDKALKI